MFGPYKGGVFPGISFVLIKKSGTFLNASAKIVFLLNLLEFVHKNKPRNITKDQ